MWRWAVTEQCVSQYYNRLYFYNFICNKTADCMYVSLSTGSVNQFPNEFDCFFIESPLIPNYEMIINLPWVCFIMLIAWFTYYAIMNRNYSRIVLLALCRWQVVINNVAGSELIDDWVKDHWVWLHCLKLIIQYS